LSCRDVRPVMKAARRGTAHFLDRYWPDMTHPIADCCSGLLGDLELDRSAGLPLDHRGAVPDSAPDAHVVDLEPHEATAPQLAVEGQMEQSEVASALFELRPDADCPDLLWLQRALLPDEAAFVPGGTMEETSAASMPSMVVSSDRPAPPQHVSFATRSGSSASALDSTVSKSLGKSGEITKAQHWRAECLSKAKDGWLLTRRMCQRSFLKRS
jgi:hypothetical protein